MEGDPLDKVIALVVAAGVGIILVVSVFLPIAAGQIDWATGKHNEGTDLNPNWVDNIPGLDSINGGSTGIGMLLSVVVIMVIVGLIVAVVSYLRSGR